MVKSFIDFISKTHIAPLCLFQSFKELINRPMSPPGKRSLWGSNEVKPRSKKVARPEPCLHSTSEGQRLFPSSSWSTEVWSRVREPTELSEVSLPLRAYGKEQAPWKGCRHLGFAPDRQ